MQTDDPGRVHRLESSKELRERAQQFRREPTDTEDLLWEALRNRQFLGLKFRRQRPIGPFIADFLCIDRRLVFEVDGSVHDAAEVRAHDALRDDWLQSRGFTVLYLSANLVLTDLPRALQHIADTLACLADPFEAQRAGSARS